MSATDISIADEVTADLLMTFQVSAGTSWLIAKMSNPNEMQNSIIYCKIEITAVCLRSVHGIWLPTAISVQ